jgi:hypothetical protein
MFCIECKKENANFENKKILCLFCGKKVDKYIQTNDTYKILDCFLLKQPIFRHYLCNSMLGPSDLLLTLFFQHLSDFLLYFSNTKISKLEIDNIKIGFHFENITFRIICQFLYILFIKISFYNIPFIKLLHAIYFSSFFNYLKIIFAIWEYKDVQYYIILEILNCCSNICALKCYEDNHLKTCFTIIISKILSYAILMYIITSDTANQLF